MHKSDLAFGINFLSFYTSLLFSCVIPYVLLDLVVGCLTRKMEERSLAILASYKTHKWVNE